MLKQKLPVVVILSFFIFVGGLDFVQAASKPSWCGTGEENVVNYTSHGQAGWNNCCVGTYDEAKCTGGTNVSTSADSSNNGGGETYDSPVSSDNNWGGDYNSPDTGDQVDYQPAPDSDSIEADMIANDSSYGQQLVNPSSSGGSSGGSLGDLSGLAGSTGLPNPSGGIKAVLDNVLNWGLGIFGALALLAFVISGIMYLTAAGESTRMENAKKAMIWSIIGVAVGLGGVVILQTIDYLLR